MMKLDLGTMIYFCGSSGAGKTTIAKKITNILNVDYVISTDDIREVLRSRCVILNGVYDSQTYDDLKSYKCYEILNTPSYITPDFKLQCKIVSSSLAKLIIRKQQYKKNTIFEGINILPSELLKLNVVRGTTHFINLISPDEAIHKDRLKSRNIDIECNEGYLNYYENIKRIEQIISLEFETLATTISQNHKIYAYSIRNIDINTTIEMILDRLKSAAQHEFS